MNIPHQSAFNIDLNLDPLWCAWFSGWVDGEGSFNAEIGKRDRGIRCTFSVAARDDETPLIYNVLGILQCGKITTERGGNSSKIVKTSHDVIRWRCVDTGACRHILIPLFDAYPLRSKKLRDYKIWREIVMLISEEQHLNGNRAYVLDLCQQLKDIKKYVPPNLVDA